MRIILVFHIVFHFHARYYERMSKTGQNVDSFSGKILEILTFQLKTARVETGRHLGTKLADLSYHIRYTIIIQKIFVLSLSYLRLLSNQLFLKAELLKNFG